MGVVNSVKEAIKRWSNAGMPNMVMLGEVRGEGVFVGSLVFVGRTSKGGTCLSGAQRFSLLQDYVFCSHYSVFRLLQFFLV